MKQRAFAYFALMPLVVLTAACTGTDSSPTTAPEPTTVTVTTSVDATSPPSEPQQPTSAGTATTQLHTAGTPTKPSRDDANVDARDFQTAPSHYNFISPSGNVWCAIRTETSPGELRFGCQARTSVPGSSGVTCRNTDNHSYAVRIEGPNVIQFCTSQGLFTAEHPRTLQYGETIMVRGDSCTSTTAGVTCYGQSGFIISRDVNKVLP